MLTLVFLLLQAPGDGWALAQVPAREVKTIYWDLYGTSETFVSLIPSDPAGGSPLVRLVLQALFVGKEPRGSPSRLVLRALPFPSTVVTQYSFQLVVDQKPFELGSAGK